MKNLTALLIGLSAILVLAVIAQEIRKDEPKPREYQFDVLNDSTILISGGNTGDDWYTISSDSLTEFLIEDNQ